MSLNKCAFIIPLHPKHFTYGKGILEKTIDADIYFVFTTEKEKETFKVYNPKLNDSFALVLTDFIKDLRVLFLNNGFVTVKKLYALSILYSKYDYIACVDSEIQFLKSEGFYEMMKDMSELKTIYGGDCQHFKEHKEILIKTLLQVTPHENGKELARLSNGFTSYTWWSNIPVYNCAHVRPFLDWIHFSVESLPKFTWYVFDNMLYDYYCILFHQYKLIVVPGIQRSLEQQTTDVIENVNTNIGKLYWVNSTAFRQNSVYYLKNNFFIVYHLDRR